MTPRISVITAVFNGAKYLDEAMHSVFSQRYPNVEYIVIDGGSTDGSVDIIKKNESQLAYWASEPDKGMYDALNKGFARSTGEIMCWLNCDDKFHPDSFRAVSEIFGTLREVEWITGNPTVFDSEGICRSVIKQRRWSKYDYLRGDYFTIQQESVFWRRSVWDRTGATLRADLKLAGDFDLWMRFFRSDAKLYATQALLGGFRRHSGEQLSHNPGAYQKEVTGIYSQLRFTEAERLNLLKIKRLERIQKIPLLRSLYTVNQRLEKIMDYPAWLTYNFESRKYELHG